MWTENQSFEAGWWGDCRNTYGEESKQLTYARAMGLIQTPHNGTPHSFDMENKSIIDIGGGPVSLLLKCRRVKRAKVVEPCKYPAWVWARYAAAGIEVSRVMGEEVQDAGFDEAWIYNVLQHVEDPEKIIKNALRAAKVLRIFEWINVPPHEGHPHELKAEILDKWIGGAGYVGKLVNENGCTGDYYAGVFVKQPTAAA